MRIPKKKNFCILVALPEEFNSVVEVFSPYLTPAAKGSSERFGRVPGDFSGNGGHFVIRQCRSMQNTWAAAATAAILSDYQPNLLIFIGIAGALQPRHVRLGDVVIADSIRSRSFSKICDKVSVEGDPAFASYDELFALRAASPDVPIISQRTRQLVEATIKKLSQKLISPDIEQYYLDEVAGAAKAGSRDCKIHCEQIFSWDLVLDSESYRQSLVKVESKAYALDMETFGFYSVVNECAGNQKIVADAVVFRGISDYAAIKAPKAQCKTDWRQVAAKNAASAALEFMKVVELGYIGATNG